MPLYIALSKPAWQIMMGPKANPTSEGKTNNSIESAFPKSGPSIYSKTVRQLGERADRLRRCNSFLAILTGAERVQVINGLAYSVGDSEVNLQFMEQGRTK
ncbi:hypothetical protein [Desulfatitalea alkaliphila]|uniref:Uncharacterized protein n=1 Tax=Desulfatitalea alkaliphila TaxID=2929485 RepID=A0AA41R0H3_9BACT|nr:hypothetical protein [Desulfatitalea alkaliphila]MCJ8499852.1 hypothetical protein [Desulfatitalea alkaliphila]